MNTIQNNYNKITVSDMAPHVHKFEPYENKVEKILAWMIDWIDSSLELRKINPHDLLPSKADLACHIGVSQGTMQTVYRLLEDKGYVESKQRVGTFIKSRDKKNNIEKLTSRRDLAKEIVKKYLIENNYQVGDVLLSTRKLAKYIGISNTTLRTAVASLVLEGVLQKKKNVFVVSNIDIEVKKIDLKTLVDKITDELRGYIVENFASGDKIPSNSELVKIFDVSAKTIHESIKQLTREGLLFSRRGQYGTIVADSQQNNSAIYFYEKYEQKIRNYIAENLQIGDKLPSIKEFSKAFDTSEKTIKKALDNLADDGFVTFVRGRYGGTFVTDIPQVSGDAYKWLAISNDYIAN